MKATQEVGVATLGVGDDQVLMRGHERDAVHQDPKLTGADGQSVEVELAAGGVGAEQVMTTKGGTGEHHGVAGQDETGLSHAGSVRTESANSLGCDFNTLPRLNWRIPSTPMMNANWVGSC